MLTGESLPVTLDVGSTVTGGSINGEGLIVFTATKVGGDTALAQIIRMVEDAQGKKAPRKVGMAPVFREGFEYEMSVFFELSLDHSANAGKDRTG